MIINKIYLFNVKICGHARREIGVRAPPSTIIAEVSPVLIYYSYLSLGNVNIRIICEETKNKLLLTD